MENDSNIDTDSLLKARGFNSGYGGFGFGGNNGGYLSAEASANGTATKTSIDCNSRAFQSGLDRISDQAEESRRISAFDTVNKNIVDAEFRGIDRSTATSQLIIDGQKEAAKCCCDAKLLAQQNACDTQRLIIEKAANTDALILAVEGRANLDKLNEARAEITYLRGKI